MIAWLCVVAFDFKAMGIGLVVAIPAVAAIEILHPPDRAAVWLGGLGAWLLFLAAVSYSPQPEALAIGLVAPIVLLLAVPRRWPGVASGPLAVAVIVALWAIVLLEHENSLWYLAYNFIPGGSAIRSVARMGLAVLIPASIGFAAFFATPWARRRPLLAGLICASCVIEQGLTTPAYDKAGERERIAALSSRVDRTSLAFYYRPPETAPTMYHLDAMWMSLGTGVPTVNGYSGGRPRGWRLALMMVD